MKRLILLFAIVAASAQSNIQTLDGWQSCSPCAGVGGHGPAADFRMTEHIAAPSLSGASARFDISGPTPYANALWWKQLGARNDATVFAYHVDFYTTAPQFAQSLEFDVNQSIGRLKFIFGTQCDTRGDGQWDVWDTAGNTWVPTGVACVPPAAFTWHHLTWYFTRDDRREYYESFNLDGVVHYINKSFAAKPVDAIELNVAFQMDGDHAQHAYSVWLDNVTLLSR